MIAFTGPSRLSGASEDEARRVLRGLPTGCTWRSGAAYGLDTLVVEEATCAELFIPLGMRSNASHLLTRSNVVASRYVRGGYRARNEALVAGADVLHAFLWRDTFYRSGEWMTVNIARRAGIPVDIHIL